MIQLVYEVYCDYCGRALNHYIGKRPTTLQLLHDGFTCTATKTFCNNACYGDWNHDLLQKRYLNLHPDGRIHRDG